MSQPIIEIKGITRDFPLGNEIVYVLKGIDLTIQKGEYVALMGPSGSYFKRLTLCQEQLLWIMLLCQWFMLVTQNQKETNVQPMY